MDFGGGLGKDVVKGESAGIVRHFKQSQIQLSAAAPGGFFALAF